MSERRSVSGDVEAAAPVEDDLPTAPPPASESAAREARVRLAAYARYEKRGAESGHDVEDWLAAEAEIEAAATASEPSDAKSA